jgi:Peptidase family S41
VRELIESITPADEPRLRESLVLQHMSVGLVLHGLGIAPSRNLVNRKGHLFVLIGVQTFSAAMANAAHFRQMTAATLVGRTIGENPNSYQEPREQTMPNSKLVFRYSTKLYEFNKGGENAIRPDHEVIASWDEYKAGRDPVLEWVVEK